MTKIVGGSCKWASNLARRQGEHASLAPCTGVGRRPEHSHSLHIIVLRDDPFVSPGNPTSMALREGCLSKVWEYRSEGEAMALCDAFVGALADHSVCEEGVLEAINWCLYEVMDNVFQHSRAASGFAMMQVHVNRRWAAVSVADSGIGIHRSFLDGGIRAHDAYDAIMLAVQERKTSKPKNMGNGLYGLMRVVGLNRGILEIRSGRGRLRYEDRRATGESRVSRPVLETTDHHSTWVDWQIDLCRPVSIIEALGMDKGRSNLRLEALEDTDGLHRVLVADFEEGLGTRRSAEHVRNRLTNILNEGAPVLRLDFTGVTVVSSSFADEVLGKLALEMGLLQFMKRFELVSMTPTIEAIVERAIQQRIAEGDETTPGSSKAPAPRTKVLSSAPPPTRLPDSCPAMRARLALLFRSR